MSGEIRKKIKASKRVVIKLGSQVLFDRKGKPDKKIFNQLAQTCARLIQQGKKIALVSSGAIASGIARLGEKKIPKTMPEKQAIASLGQPILMQYYQKAFAPYKLPVGQVLLTHDDFSSRARYLHSKNTLETLFKMGIIPIINENDAVSVEEIQFGDNDQLASLVAVMLGADLLVLLSVIKGFCDSDPLENPQAKVIPIIRNLDQQIYHCLGEGKTELGRGGMESKLRAAEIAASAGIPTFIGSGKDPEVLEKLFEGKILGSLILPEKKKLPSFKHWLLFAGKPRGKIQIDAGAVQALVERKKSLLPSGVVEVKGRFEAGELVEIVDPEGREIARGLVNYSSSELEKIKGHKTDQIEKILGRKDYDEVVHRDHLVMAEKKE